MLSNTRLTVSVTLNLDCDAVTVATSQPAVVTVVLFNIFTSVVANTNQYNLNQSFSQVTIQIVTAAGWLGGWL